MTDIQLIKIGDELLKAGKSQAVVDGVFAFHAERASLLSASLTAQDSFLKLISDAPAPNLSSLLANKLASLEIRAAISPVTLHSRYAAPTVGQMQDGQASITIAEIQNSGKMKINAPGDIVPGVTSHNIAETATAIGHQVSSSYSFSVQELRTAAIMGVELNSAGVLKCQTANTRFLNTLVTTGVPEIGKTGLFNDTGVTTSIAAGATAPERLWENKTFEKIQADIEAVLLAIWEKMGENFGLMPNAVILPPKQFALLDSRKIEGSETSYLEYFRKHNFAASAGSPIEFILGTSSLNGLGAGNTGRAIFYNKDRENFTYHVAQPLTFLAPQLTGLGILVPARAYYSSILWAGKSGAIYLEGI